MMNKYQEALEYINKKCKLDRLKFDSMIGNEMVSRIDELVEKETPMKVTNIHVDEWYCPNCYQEIGTDSHYKRCPECGQKLDWSDE